MQLDCVRFASLIVLVASFAAAGCRDSGRTTYRQADSPVAETLQPDESSADSHIGSGSRDYRTDEERAALAAPLRPKVEKFCGDCHANPRPASSTHEEWVDEVNQGFVLYGESGRVDLEVPPYDEVLNFFQYQAPDTHVFPSSIRNYPSCSIKLRQTNIRFPGSRPPGVTNVRWIDIGLKQSNALVYCDIGTGAVMAHWPLEDESPTQRLATLYQPVHSEACDLDHDGLTDLVVADVGEFNAEDSNLGRVVWLRRKPDSDKFDKIVLLEDIGRVADVQPGDFDNDGDLDLLVGVFGWRKTGRILLLENPGAIDENKPEFVVREIDERSGAVHVPPIDLNDDGHLDFVVLLSQHHERVEAFINDGEGNFKRELIWAAPDPAYGSSGIELVDMDTDGDMDILYTNGDSFDRGPKPHHSVQWLENQGSYPYKHHTLCPMPGVLNATAADFDNDGDMDVVATSIVANELIDELRFDSTPSVVMLIQDSPGQFVPTKIEVGDHTHLSVESGDFNDDEKTDFAIGAFHRQEAADRPDVVMWLNES